MIVISELLVSELLEAAIRSSPMEICGLAVGHIDQGEKFVDELIFLRNIDPSPTVGYTVDSSQLIDSLTSLEKAGKAVLAIFHSHPMGPVHPSRIDTEKVSWLDHSHLIIVPKGKPELSSWQWDDNVKNFAREPLKITR